MIENYKQDKNGVIQQINRKPFSYDYNYSDNYNSELYKENSKVLSGARVGFSIANHNLFYGYTKVNSILDIGYGNGEFLKQCSKFIPNCYGYDVSPYKLDSPIKLIDTMEEVLSTRFDIITFWDSLEHFENIDFIENLKCDIICISMPYCHWNRDEDDEWFKNWKHRKPDEHLYHFNPRTLCNFMESKKYKPLIMNSNIEEIVRQNKNEPRQNIFSSCYMKLY